MSVIHTPRKPELDARVLAFPLAMGGLLSMLFFRLWYYQVVESPSLVERAEETQTMATAKMAPRGLIFDRQGKQLATVRPQIVVTVTPNEIKDHPEVLPKVAQVLGVPMKKLERRLREAEWRPYLASPLYVGATIEAGTKLAESIDEFPGIGVETLPMRFYSDSKSFSHALGYVWTPDSNDVDRIKSMGKDTPDYVGKSGIERAYEAQLMGTAGSEEIEVDARRRPIRVASRNAPVPGSQLYLSLDGRLQKKATELLAGKGYIGGVAAIDPKTGEVLCLVSSPTYDQRLFEGGISVADWDRLSKDENHPLINRAIMAAYPPGSTFKIVTAVAAMQQGKWSPYTHYHCAGGYFKGGVKLKCLGFHGDVSFYNAMTKSCNAYFCSLGAAVGEDALRKASLDMGLGTRPELEIGGARGLVPTRDWIKAVNAEHKYVWYAGDTANFSIGQGYMNTTPIQMANVAAMVANDGVRYEPHLVHAIKDAKSGVTNVVPPKIAGQIQGTPEFWSAMKSALQNVVDAGTAQTAKVPGIHVGGKTGSAEHKKGLKTHGWFVGFAPVEDPKIAICVLVEAAGHGGEVAAPIAGQLIKTYLSNAPEKRVANSETALDRSTSPANR